MKKYNCDLVLLFLIHNFSLVFCMDAPFTKYDRVFLNACRDGKPIELVLSMANMYAVDPENGFTGLHYAAQSGHIETVRRLLKDQNEDTYNRLVRAQCKNGMSPFNYAFKRDYDVTKKMLMDYTLEHLMIIDISSAKFIPLAQACIDVGDIDINADYGCRYGTPLLTMCACYAQGDLEKVRFLLDAGANVNLSSGGNIPIFTALKYSKDIPHAERLELIKLFIDRGADINAVGTDCSNLMHTAILLNDVAVINFLIEKKIKLGVIDKSGKNEIHYAIESGNEDILKLLLNKSIPMISAVGEDRVCPLHTAVLWPNSAMTKVILEKMKELHTDINTLLDHEGQTPLHYAAEYGSLEVVQMLLDAGAQQLSDENHNFPLELALSNKNPKVWQLLTINFTESYIKFVGNEFSDSSAQGDKKTKRAEKEQKNDKKAVDNASKKTPEKSSEIIEKKSLDVTVVCAAQPKVLNEVAKAVTPTLDKIEQDNVTKQKSGKKLSISMPKTLNYAAAVIGKGLHLAAQTMDFRDDVGRLTRLHIPAGFYAGDMSSLNNYKKTKHVEKKAHKKSDLFHDISDEQVKMVLKHGEMFGTRNDGRVKCYRMPTTKDAFSITYDSGSLEVSVDTQTNKIVHAFYNKKNENKAIALS